MKLIYVTSMLPYGAKEAFFIPEILELRRRGHDVVVVPMYPRGSVVHSDAEEFLKCVIAAHPVSLSVCADAVSQWVGAPARTLAALAPLRRSRNARILAKNVAIAAKGLWLGRLARRWGAQHIHAQWASTPSTMAFIANRLTGIPWSFTAHRWDIAEDNLAHAKAASAAFVRAIDEAGAAELRRTVGPSASKVRVIHMGARLLLTDSALARPDGTNDSLRIVVAANLVPKKGHAFALEAAARLRERGLRFSVDIVGDGPLRRELVSRAAALGVVDCVRFRGVVGHRELLMGLQSGSWDVALLPSIVADNGEREGIPVFLIEAMASGIPVVSTRTGGIPELLDGGAGILVEERNAEAIADAVWALAASPAHRAALGRAGIARVREAFTVERAMDALESLMRDREGTGEPSASSAVDGAKDEMRGTLS